MLRYCQSSLRLAISSRADSAILDATHIGKFHIYSGNVAQFPAKETHPEVDSVLRNGSVPVPATQLKFCWNLDLGYLPI